MTRTHRPAALLVLVALLFACKSGDDTTDIEFTISPQTAQLLPGETVQLTAVGASAAVTWSSSNSAVATVVPQTGFVTAVGRGTATISAVAGSVVRSATVNVLAPPQIQVPAEVVFDITEGDNDPAPTLVNVTNVGDGTLQGVTAGPPQYAQGGPTGWLTVQLAGTQISLRVQRGVLPVGEYTAAVPVTATNAVNSPQSILVRFRIVARPAIAVSVDPVALSTTPGGTDTRVVQVTNGGGRTLDGLSVRVDYGGGATGWLQATLAATTAPANLTIVAMAGQLPLGSYSANVVIESTRAGVTPFLLRVTLTVTPSPRIALSRTNVPFSAVFQGTPPSAQTVTVTNGGGGTLSGLALGTIQYGAGANGWLSATLSGTGAPATITLNVNQGQLPQGNYTATLPVTSPVAENSPTNITVTMTVGPAPQITATPTSLTFGTFRNGTVPAQQSVALGSSTGQQITGLTFEVVYFGGASGWLNVTLRGGATATPATLDVRPNSVTLARGTWTAAVRVSSTMTGTITREIPISYTVSTFDIDIYPLFTAGNPGGFPRLPCTQCHGGAATGSFANATNAYNYLTANQGVLICKITGGAACPSEMRMPGGSVGLVQSWLGAGAPR